MGIGRGTAARFAAAAAAVLLALSLPAAGSSAAAAEGHGERRPCFEACFDQCVPRDEFWFCQLSCYTRCAAGRYRAFVAPGHHLGCEQSCVLSLCAELRPGSKMMAACQDTCSKSYAVAACRGA